MKFSNNNRIAKNTGFLYIRMLFTLFVSLYTTRVVLNILGATDYGIYNVVSGFVLMFAFLNTSLSNGIQRFYNFKLGSEGEGSLVKVYNTAIQIQGGLSIVLLLLLETIGLWYLNYQIIIPYERIFAANVIYQFSVISLLFVVMGIPYSAALLAYEKMDEYAYISMLDVILKLVMVLILPFMNCDRLIFYGLFYMLITLLNLLLYVFCCLKFKSIKFRKIWDKELFKSMLSFSGWNVFGAFAYVLKGQGVNLLLNSFFGVLVNAANGIAAMVQSAIYGFSQNIAISFRPQLIQSYAAGNYDRVRKLMFSLSKISYILLYMLSVPVVIELKYIFHLWIGNSVPSYAASFTILVLINMVISSFATPLSHVVHATGNMKKFQITTSAIICGILPISYIFLKLGFDPMIVFIISIVMAIINQIVCMFVLKQLFDYSLIDYIKIVVFPCFIFTILTPILPIIIHMFLHHGFICLCTVVFTSLASSVTVAYTIVLDKAEREIIKQYISKILKK